MKNLQRFCLVAVILITASCSAPLASAPTTAPTPEPTAPALTPPTLMSARPAVLHLEVPVDPDISDLPRLMAAEALEAQGYNIEPLSMSDTVLTIQAMEQGQLDIAVVTNSQTWTAISKGAALLSIMGHPVTHLVIGGKDIENCADMDGKKVGVNSMNSTQAAMLRRFIEQECPGIKPEYLVIAGTNNRLSGLIAGSLDAATLDLTDMIELNSQGRDDMNLVVQFSEAFPGVSSSSEVTRRVFAEQHPETVKDYLRAEIEARRQLQDPVVLREQLVKYMKMSEETATTTAKTFIEQKVWDLNGGLSAETTQKSIDLLESMDAVPAGLKPEDVADPSFLNAVLDELGRK